MITLKKYQFLKKFKSGLTEEQMKQVKEFETKRNTVELSEKNKEYFKKVFTKEPNPDNFKIKYDVLLEKFLLKYEEVEGVDFNLERLKEIEPILYYFCKDDRFFKCKNLSNLSEPSFDKGLLIMGSYGTGKTSTMKTLKALFNNTPLSFKTFTANKIVSSFEGHSVAEERHSFMERAKTGRIYYDDVKAEKDASNYGKFNLMREILDYRSTLTDKTFITSNYKEGTGTDLQKGVDEFLERYGERVHDRLFKMFNIIEVNGKSLRR